MPLFWQQVRIRNLARQARRDGTPLAGRAAGHMALRSRLAVLALVLLVAVYALMVVKPL
ncbi:hypothetical protein D3C86_2173480 [compost metagenome]